MMKHKINKINNLKEKSMSKQNKIKKVVEEKSTKEKPEVKKEVKLYHDKETLVRMYEKEGMSCGQIARHFSVTRTAILIQMKKHNIDLSKTRKSASKDAKKNYQDKKWLETQIEKGATILNIAKNQGVSYTTVHYFAKTLLGDARKIEVSKKNNSKTKSKK